MQHDERSSSREVHVLLAVLLCVLAAVLAFLVFRALRVPAPPRPVIRPVGLPANPTSETAARFTFTDAKAVTFECTLDGSAFAVCGAGYVGSKAYPGPLGAGQHVFQVRAVSHAKRSSAASYSWAVRPTASSGPIGVEKESPFGITGRVRGLVPGMSRVIRVTLTNPNPVTIHVTALTVALSADSVPPGCSSATNFLLRQATGITPASPVTVPAGGSVTVAGYPRAPEIAFRNLPTDQGVCKGKRFVLTYTGRAHS